MTAVHCFCELDARSIFVDRLALETCIHFMYEQSFGERNKIYSRSANNIISEKIRPPDVLLKLLRAQCAFFQLAISRGN